MTHPSMSRGGLIGMPSRTAAVKTSVTEEFKESIGRYWRARGYASEGEFLLELLMVTVLGKDEVTNMHARRIASLAGLAPVTRPETASDNVTESRP